MRDPKNRSDSDALHDPCTQPRPGVRHRARMRIARRDRRSEAAKLRSVKRPDDIVQVEDEV